MQKLHFPPFLTCLLPWIQYFPFFFLHLCFLNPLALQAQPSQPNSHITVVGAVYCDVCHDNTFSRHSYFLPGVDVHIQCKFQANSPRTAEQITFSVNRTTNKYGVYMLDIASVDGIDCVDGPAIQSLCQASLVGSSSPACNAPGLKTTSDEITVKSRQDNLCIYSLNSLSYRPSKRNATLCGNQKGELPKSLDSSKFFLPYFPRYAFPWPPLPQLPPLPPLPPLTSIPLPPLPFFPLPYPRPSLIPFPLPPLPPLTDPPPIPPPSPPTLNGRDPRTWIPHNPLLSPPPPPAFNWRDPRTWIPNNPLLSPPPPSAFNWRDPRTWIPYVPPSPPNIPESQQP